MSHIVSSTPGRIRVRHVALRQRGLLDRLQAGLAGLDHAISVQANAVAGSLILLYDAATVEKASVEAQVDAVVRTLLGQDPLAPHRTRSNPTMKRRANRYAKYGMLGGLATSLALAAAGKKRLHVLTGGVFVACLGVHMAIHRRHLLK